MFKSDILKHPDLAGIPVGGAADSGATGNFIIRVKGRKIFDKKTNGDNRFPNSADMEQIIAEIKKDLNL